MSGQRHIGHVPIHAERRQHMRPVDRHALGLVHRRGIAVIKMAILGKRDPHRTTAAIRICDRDVDPAVGIGALDPLDPTTGAVLHAEPAVVAAEQHLVVDPEAPLAVLGRRRHTPICLVRFFPKRPRPLVQVPHIRSRVRQHDPAIVRPRTSLHLPFGEQSRLGIVERRMPVHRAGRLVAVERLGGAACRQIPCRLLLPGRALPPHLSDLDTPTRSAIARKAAPASIACSCSGSPTSTILAPAFCTVDSTRSI